MRYRINVAVDAGQFTDDATAKARIEWALGHIALSVRNRVESWIGVGAARSSNAYSAELVSVDDNGATMTTVARWPILAEDDK